MVTDCSVVTWLDPRETAAVSAQVLCTHIQPCNQFTVSLYLKPYPAVDSSFYLFIYLFYFILSVAASWHLRSAKQCLISSSAFRCCDSAKHLISAYKISSASKWCFPTWATLHDQPSVNSLPSLAETKVSTSRLFHLLKHGSMTGDALALQTVHGYTDALLSKQSTAVGLWQRHGVYRNSRSDRYPTRVAFRELWERRMPVSYFWHATVVLRLWGARCSLQLENGWYHLCTSLLCTPSFPLLSPQYSFCTGLPHSHSLPPSPSSIHFAPR